ncbi:MAG TPA: hypothetical protein VF055_03840 [Steroidobacteraceae bacterium]
MTITKFALPALLALALVAACSGKQEPAAGAAMDDEEEETAGTPAPEPSKDYVKMAQGMMSLLADAPECQSYRDELQAIVDAPAGATPAREPSHVVAAAHDAGCSKKSRGE